MPKKRTGLPSFAYMGVEASTPPNLVMHGRAPTANDYAEYNIGTIWIYQTDPQEVWILVNKDAKVALWIEIFTSLSGGIQRVDGEWNITTVNPTGPTVEVYLDTSIHQPNTNAAGDEGVYFLGAAGGVGGNTFMHAMGTQNTFLGQSSGNLGLTVGNAVRNTCVGFQTLRDNVDGNRNTAIGDSALATIVDGDRNVAVGAGNLDLASDVDFNTSVGEDGLTQLLTGDYNTTLGYRSGFEYVGAESSNILIGNEGVAAESNVIRLGTEGNGAGQQDATYVAGFYTNAPGATTRVGFVDDDGRLASSTGNDGQVLIGATGGNAAWRTLTPGVGIAIANLANSITITATGGGGGGGGAATFVTDVNSPATIGGTTSIDILGDGIIETDGGGGSNTVTVGIPGDTHGDLLLTDGAGDTVWGNITSTGGSITITYPGAGAADTINLEAVGAGGGANTFQTDAGNGVAVAGVIDILGGTNINTAGAGAVVTINLDDSIALPDTNVAGTTGVIKLASGTTFMHNRGAAGTSYNTFLGEDAGNLAVITTAVDSTGIGYQSLNSLNSGISNSCFASGSGRDISTGDHNTTLGFDSGTHISSGSSNCTVGSNSFNGIVTGSNNIGLGTLAGSNCTAGDSSNILIGYVGSAGLDNTIVIGTQGAGAGQQDECYIAGIHNVTPAGATEMVIIDAAGQLGSEIIAVGDVTAVNGGTNITTVNAGGPVVTVNLDPSVTLAGSMTVGTTLTVNGLGRGVVQSSAGGLFSSSEGNNGYILIGSNAGAVAWANITSVNGSISITNGNNSINIEADKLSINSQGGSYTLVLTDAGKEVKLTNGGAINLTIPSNAAVAFPTGTEIILVQGGAGTVTVAPAGGVTIQSAGGRRDLFEQYSAAALIKQSANVWLLAGDIK